MEIIGTTGFQIINYSMHSPVKFLLIIFCFFGSTVLFAQQNKINVKRTDDFTVTGDGSNKAWNTAVWNTITQRSSATLKMENWYITDDRLKINDLQYQTQFKILYSDKGIYCLFYCEDSAITSTIKEDFGDLFNEDVVEAFFWPDTSRVIYFEYELSPMNYELPLIIFNNNGNANGWLPFYYKNGRKTDHAINISNNKITKELFTWTAEFFIPYTLLSSLKNIPPQKGMQWRANFYRIDYDQQPVFSSWQLTRESYHDPEKFGVIEFE
ncbi:hypothetical protein BH10BAC2_BH10BAC2_38140 [soil metagenome]